MRMVLEPPAVSSSYRTWYPPTGYWKYGFTPCGSGVLSSATIINEI